MPGQAGHDDFGAGKDGSIGLAAGGRVVRLPGIQATEAEPAVEGAAAAAVSGSDGGKGAAGLELEEDGGTVPV